MEKDSKFTRDEDGYIAIRTVSAPYSSGTDDKDSMFTRDEDGYVAVRTIAGSGGGGGDQHNLGYYATPTALREAYPTAEAGDWAIVGSTDTVWIWDTDTSAWVDSDQKGQVTSVNNQTGAVTVQETLVSGTNIKTVNNTSLLGSGNITIDSLPTQTGNSGKFLTTDGTDASWSDKPLVNVATGTDSIAIGGTSSNVRSVAIGVGSSTSANNSTAIGKGASSGSAGVSIGYSANSNGLSSIAIGSSAAATANGSIQINAYTSSRTNSDANTFKVGNANGNYEMMSADGTIPEARLADTTSATAGQALVLNSQGNAEWKDVVSTPATAPTLLAANWSSNQQTVNVTGVTATNMVIVAPYPTDAEDYAAAGVLCVAQGSGTLTFSCTTTPVNDLQVNVVII